MQDIPHHASDVQRPNAPRHRVLLPAALPGLTLMVAAAADWRSRPKPWNLGVMQARDLLQHLWTGPISNAPVDIVQGSKSVEVRPVGISKVRDIRVVDVCVDFPGDLAHPFFLPHIATDPAVQDGECSSRKFCGVAMHSNAHATLKLAVTPAAAAAAAGSGAPTHPLNVASQLLRPLTQNYDWLMQGIAMQQYYTQ